MRDEDMLSLKASPLVSAGTSSAYNQECPCCLSGEEDLDAKALFKQLKRVLLNIFMFPTMDAPEDLASASAYKQNKKKPTSILLPPDAARLRPF